MAGIAFVVLSVVVVTLGNPLDSHKSKQEFARYYGDFRGSSHEWRELLAPFVAVLAAFCFCWFLRRVRDLVRDADDGLAAITVGGGFVAITLLLAAVVAASAVGTAAAYSDDYRIDLDTAILMSNVALFLYTVAGAGAAVMVWAASLAARRGRLLPAWLVWAGFVVALGNLLTIALDGLSFLLLMLWVLVLSVELLRRAPGSSVA